MNILYHNRTRGKAVEGVHIREIANALKKLGNNVYVVSPPGVDPMKTANSPNNQSFINKAYKFISRYLPQIFFEILELAYNIIGYNRINSIIKKHNIDAIYERYAFFTWIGTYTAKKKKIPIIIEVNEISGIERVRKQILVKIAQNIENKIFKKADAIIVVSNFLKRKIIERTGVSPNKIFVMPNAADLDKFNLNVDGSKIRKDLRLENQIVIGFVGSFVNWSNLENFVQIFSEISKEKDNVHLMMVGDGPLMQLMIKIVEKNNLKEKVTFTGSVNHNDVPRYISAMDICVIPKSNEYRSPVKLFEYMAMCKPVIAPRLEPIECVITHEQNGILFDQDDYNSFKNSIIYAIENRDKCAKIAESAYKTILGNYTWTRNAEGIINIYKGLTNV